jgi:hypothetical protein
VISAANARIGASEIWSCEWYHGPDGTWAESQRLTSASPLRRHHEVAAKSYFRWPHTPEARFGSKSTVYDQDLVDIRGFAAITIDFIVEPALGIDHQGDVGVVGAAPATATMAQSADGGAKMPGVSTKIQYAIQSRCRG